MYIWIRFFPDPETSAVYDFKNFSSRKKRRGYKIPLEKFLKLILSEITQLG